MHPLAIYESGKWGLDEQLPEILVRESNLLCWVNNNMHASQRFYWRARRYGLVFRIEEHVEWH
jgi:hypothetical protein